MQTTNKSLNLLEIKLNKLLQRKSEILNENKKVKVKIDHLRLMRRQTDVAHSNFETVLSDSKGLIDAYLEDSGDVVKRREDLVREIEELQAVNVAEQQVFEEAYDAMGEFIVYQNDALEQALLEERKADQRSKMKGGAFDEFGAPTTVNVSGNGNPATTNNNNNAGECVFFFILFSFTT